MQAPAPRHCLIREAILAAVVGGFICVSVSPVSYAIPAQLDHFIHLANQR